MKKKLLSLTMILTLLFAYFAPITNLLAAANTTNLQVSFRQGENQEGIVQYSLNDGATWIDVTGNLNQNISVSGDNLRLRIVPNQNKEVDYAGVELSLDGTNAANVNELGLDSPNGYSVDSNVVNVRLINVEFKDQGGNPGRPVTTGNITVSLSGPGLEYDQPWNNNQAADLFIGINDGQVINFTNDQVDFDIQNNEIVGFTTKQPIEYQYDHADNESKVRFIIRTQWDDVYTSLKINNTLINTPTTREELTQAFINGNGGIEFTAEVDYAQNYNIEIVGRKQTEEEKIMGNFGWTYDSNTNQYSDDDKIPHGNLEFVKAVYNGTTYNSEEAVNNAGGVFKWKSANKQDDPFGEATLPPGTVLTVKLIPDSGYQLTELTLNGFPFEPGEQPGVYTFTIGGGNWHLGANFTEVGNEVDNSATNIKNGSINLNLNGDNSFVNGTAKLGIKNVSSISPSREQQFVTTATNDGYEIDSYIDMSLFNTIYKGGAIDANGKYESWDTQVDNISNNAIITLELNEDMSGKNIVLVHETHDGNTITGYEVIDTVYDEKDNTITFATNSFSDYAIAIKDSNKNTDYNVSDTNGNTISFKEEDGHSYNLNIIDYLSFTDEDLENANISKEDYDKVFDILRNMTKEQGELLAFYEIELFNENHISIHEGPFTIKIKMTEDMKKYDTFKLMYVDMDNNFSVENPILLKQEGDYLVGTLDHLSTYTLTGSKNSNPKTGDNIIFYVSILGIGIVGFITVCIIKKKKYNN